MLRSFFSRMVVTITAGEQIWAQRGGELTAELGRFRQQEGKALFWVEKADAEGKLLG
jgi:hypothetical protein